jgi:hypothetical protein
MKLSKSFLAVCGGVALILLLGFNSSRPVQALSATASARPVTVQDSLFADDGDNVTAEQVHQQAKDFAHSAGVNCSGSVALAVQAYPKTVLDFRN